MACAAEAAEKGSGEVRRSSEYNIGPTAACGGQLLLILALDTTTRAGGVAVLRDETLVASLSGEPGLTHGQRLPGDLRRALEAAHVELADLDLLAVAAGPGSFTGLRVGIAAIQGLAFAQGLKVVPVSTLDALAREAAAGLDEGDAIAPWIDAQRGQVFAALYAADGVTVDVPPSSLPPAGTLEAWRPMLQGRRVTFAGDGAVRYRDVIQATLGVRARVVDPPPPLAPAVGRIAAREPQRAVVPHAIVPIYVRRPDAELAREAGRS